MEGITGKGEVGEEEGTASAVGPTVATDFIGETTMTIHPLTEIVARAFHDSYEMAAFRHGWKTQKDCRVEFDALPEANRLTMLDATKDAIRAVLTFEPTKSMEVEGQVDPSPISSGDCYRAMTAALLKEVEGE